MKAARTGCKIAMEGSEALIIGGTNGTAELDTVEAWNADSKTMSANSYTMAMPRNAFTATRLKDGRVVVIGGTVGSTKSLKGFDGQPLGSAEIFVRQ